MKRTEGDGKIFFTGEMSHIYDYIFVALDRYVRPPMISNSLERNSLNLGGGNKEIDGAVNLQFPDWNAETDKIPYPDGSIDEIHAYHFLEHIDNVPFVLTECQRVLKEGGHMNILVPYFKGGMAFQDLDHKRFYTEDTWRILFNNQYYDKNRIDWRLKVHLNIVVGLNQKDLALFTQLVKS